MTGIVALAAAVPLLRDAWHETFVEKRFTIHQFLAFSLLLAIGFGRLKADAVLHARAAISVASVGRWRCRCRRCSRVTTLIEDDVKVEVLDGSAKLLSLFRAARMSMRVRNRRGNPQRKRKLIGTVTVS